MKTYNVQWLRPKQQRPLHFQVDAWWNFWYVLPKILVKSLAVIISWAIEYLEKEREKNQSIIKYMNIKKDSYI